MTICLSPAHALLNHVHTTFMKINMSIPNALRWSVKSPKKAATLSMRSLDLSAWTKIALETKVDHTATFQVLLVSMDVKSPADVVK